MRAFLLVIAGLDPAIHAATTLGLTYSNAWLRQASMDARVNGVPHDARVAGRPSRA